MPLKLKDSNLTLWQVTIELHKFYAKSEYSSEKAEEHFMSISDGIEPACDLEEDEWHLYSEVSYYICDSGDGDNILNDTIVMMKDDGINTDDLWDGRWGRPARPVKSCSASKPRFAGQFLNALLSNQGPKSLHQTFIIDLDLNRSSRSHSA